MVVGTSTRGSPRNVQNLLALQRRWDGFPIGLPSEKGPGHLANWGGWNQGYRVFRPRLAVLAGTAGTSDLSADGFTRMLTDAIAEEHY